MLTVCCGLGRYPNANPELGFGSTLQANGWLPPISPFTPEYEVYPLEPYRNTSYEFQQFQLGVGGGCDNFDPPAGYW
jgi:hypothetical protein